MPHLSVYLGHAQLSDSYWYLSAVPELLGAASKRFSDYAKKGDSELMERTRLLGPFLQCFFADHLVNQKGASPETIASYRDTFRILLEFLQREYGLNLQIFDSQIWIYLES